MSDALALRPITPPGVRFSIRDPLTAVAVDAVFAFGANRRVDVVITDDPKAFGMSTVMIVGESDLAAARALTMIRSHKLASACPRDLIHVVPALVSAVGAGCVAVPEELVARARRAPDLSDDLYEVLDLVRSGHSNRQIAHRLHCSLATAKRRVHDLTIVFEAQNRLELVSKTRTI